MAKENRELFYLGKGGTGKTTLSALTAVALAGKKFRVALVSMDPAHNIFDIFQISTARHYYNFSRYLRIEEIDPDYWLKKYLQTIEKQISASYHYLTALSLEKNLQIIRYAPGLEEYALSYAYRAMREKYNEYDYLIFDMPPTGLALRFFALPRLTKVWLEELSGIRKTILKKTKIINDVHRLKNVPVTDKILRKLADLQQEQAQLEASFSDSDKVSLFVVMNDDALSLAESDDIQKKFDLSGQKITGFIQNKVILSDDLKNDRFFEKPYLAILALAEEALIGTGKLDKYANGRDFQSFINRLVNRLF